MKQSLMICLCALLLSGTAWAGPADFEYVYVLKLNNGVSFAISSSGTAQPEVPTGEITYDMTGRPQKIGEYEIAYDNLSRAIKVGTIKLVYQINRVVKIGDITISYDKPGKIASIGGATIDSNQVGNPIGFKGKPGAGAELALAWTTKK